MNKAAILEKIRQDTFETYQNVPHDLPFHGWPHIEFVRRNALRFSAELNADPFLVEAAAYTHDLNYIAKVDSAASAGKDLRAELLAKSGLVADDIACIEQIVKQAESTNRQKDISAEAKALSDGDMLFKALPTTPLLFFSLFMAEGKRKIRSSAESIVKMQVPLLEQDIYFYSEGAKKYTPWAKTNLDLFQHVLACLDDEDVFLDIGAIKQLAAFV